MMKLNPDDPKLTAYALGELDDHQQAKIEKQLAQSPELLEVVDEIRETVSMLTEQFEAEPLTALSEDQRQSIFSKTAELNGRAAKTKISNFSIIRRFWFPASLAATLMMAVGVWYLLPSLSRAREFSSSLSQRNQFASEQSTKCDSNLRELSSTPRRQLYADAGNNRRNEKREIVRKMGSRRKGSKINPSVSGKSTGESYTVLVPTGGSRRSGGGGGGGGQSASSNEQVPLSRSSALSRLESLGYTSDGQLRRQRKRRPEALIGYSRIYPRSISRGKGVDGLAEIDSPTFAGFNPGANKVFVGEAHLRFGRADDGTGRFRRGSIDRNHNTESYNHIPPNPFMSVMQSPLSTFSIDVDTASYTNVRRFINNGQLPPAGAVRIEEMINYFSYDYPLPDGEDPFSVNVEVADCPWNHEHRLARIGIKGMEYTNEERPPANLVFLVDVSGSMQSANKLPLLKKSMELLVDELNFDDYVSVVVYAGASGIVLEPTGCNHKSVIFSALSRLAAGGSTNGGAGIQLAYDTALSNYIDGGINRVILATDGDFNVGITDQGSLTRLIEEKAKSGVYLTVLGFGMGNLKDSTLETLADKGNGNYAYIDTINEAQKVLVDQMTGTLVTIAKDVKIQVEFNPTEVSAYRLIGYENRMLAAEDFNNDAKDAGEIGAGHTVTAFYEIVPVGVDINLSDVDPLKYQFSSNEQQTKSEDQVVDEDSRGLKPAAQSGELMTVKLRYKQPDGHKSKLIEIPITDEGLTLMDASDDFIFASSVASFGMQLRGHVNTNGVAATPDQLTFDAVWELADGAMGEDYYGYRQEFLKIIEQAIQLQTQHP